MLDVLKYSLAVMVLGMGFLTVQAQTVDEGISDHKTLYFSLHKDTSLHSIFDFLSHGSCYGKIRNSTMATIHEGGLKDYWTNATGGVLGFESLEWFGLQFGARGSFSFNTFSSDLNGIDAAVNKSAKWEKELYDIGRPEEKRNLVRLDEFYVKFSMGKSFIRIGRMDINRGPLFLSRDGRMRPFVYRGAWVEVDEFEKHKITVGWIDGASSRPSTDWHSLNQSLGMNGNGFQPNGTKASYHTSSNIQGVGTFGYENTSIENLKLTIWNFYFQNQFDLMWLQADYKGKNLLAGLQYAHQETLNYQSRLDYEKRYIQPDNKGRVLSGLLGFKNKADTWQITGAYLRSFDSGRFLFPRELGRENFYVSQPRAWIDGFGDTDVYMIRFKHSHKSKWGNKLVFDTRLSRIETPGLDKLEFNKYNIASYYQGTFLLSYHFARRLKGVMLDFLYVAKFTEKSVALAAADKFYRTNLNHFNLILNIQF